LQRAVKPPGIQLAPALDNFYYETKVTGKKRETKSKKPKKKK
jgi:hypothetical protein